MGDTVPLMINHPGLLSRFEIVTAITWRMQVWLLGFVWQELSAQEVNPEACVDASLLRVEVCRQRALSIVRLTL